VLGVFHSAVLSFNWVLKKKCSEVAEFSSISRQGRDCGDSHHGLPGSARRSEARISPSKPANRSREKDMVRHGGEAPARNWFYSVLTR